MHSIFWFRTRQWVLSRVLHLTEHKKQTLLAAPDAVLLLPALFRKRRISRILLVTTPGFVRRGTLTSLLDGCKKENISVTIFSEIAPDPQIESVEQGFRLYQQIQAQAILAIGGGSVLDTAKLIGARVCCPKKTVPAMRGLLKVRRKLPPLFAVPTTAGTGSEATAAAVITDCIDGKPYKYAVNDLCLIPDTAVLDPRLTISLPSSMTADTGMDALTHAIEGYTTKAAWEMTDMFHLKAIEIISKSLRGAVANTKEGREGMALGQYIAGMGFSNVGLGIAHSMAHTLGAVYDTPHGVACAMMLPIVMEYNQECTGEKYREIARAMGVANVDSMSQDEYRKAAVDAVKKLSADVGIPSVLEAIKEEDLPFLAESAHADACAPGNPKDASVEDLKDLFRKIMA